MLISKGWQQKDNSVSFHIQASEHLSLGSTTVECVECVECVFLGFSVLTDRKHRMQQLTLKQESCDLLILPELDKLLLILLPCFPVVTATSLTLTACIKAFSFRSPILTPWSHFTQLTLYSTQPIPTITCPSPNHVHCHEWSGSKCLSKNTITQDQKPKL